MFLLLLRVFVVVVIVVVVVVVVVVVIVVVVVLYCLFCCCCFLTIKSPNHMTSFVQYCIIMMTFVVGVVLFNLNCMT